MASDFPSGPQDNDPATGPIDPAEVTDGQDGSGVEVPRPRNESLTDLEVPLTSGLPESEPEPDHAPMPREWVRRLYASGIQADTPRLVDVPPELHPAANDFANDIGPVMDVLNAGTGEDFTTSLIPPSELPGALFHTDRMRKTVGALAERVFVEIASEPWEDIASTLDAPDRADVGKLAAHLREHYQGSTDAPEFDPDALVPAERDDFTVTVPAESMANVDATYVGARAAGLFGALCDRDVPYFISGEAKDALLQHSVGVLDMLETTTHRLLVTATEQGMSLEEIAAHLVTTPDDIQARLVNARDKAVNRNW